ncbi:MAG: PilZ domain-containing protein [Pyrinomonadaceae bacterium]
MEERRSAGRFVVAFPIRVKWKDENGKVVVEEGLTENIGPQGTLIYLPRLLPTVGSKVELTVTENPKDEVTVKAEVIRLERNAAHPQAALMLTDQIRAWKKKVLSLAAETIANEKPEDDNDW